MTTEIRTAPALTSRDQLDILRAELERRGWIARLRGSTAFPTLQVCNPHDRGFHDTIVYQPLGPTRAAYCWQWGTEIAPAAHISQAADTIMHVLQGVPAR
ncbi:hypothetical protein Nocox_35640 [Nonomuraea coxensis DSM 45129]|uniref:Uncharacterized protein n=1 Tax=Nonomuraea coxensis DSM 45129 TaxID=1122611 RepID=A0ABX8UA86_9ACTN|nr:hypothetical protein [Nonomuraea coxensis]QYC44687.1 hypothetical protein Nocox_35640 [Nonomuraea coxensis DSM 45129]